MLKNEEIKNFLKSLKNLKKTNIWIERPRQTWNCEKKSGLRYEKIITDKNLKYNLERFYSHFNCHINEEVIKQYLIMLQTLYLCDNLDKTTDDYKKALASAGITESKLDFLGKWALQEVKDKTKKEEFNKKYNSSLRKQYADQITKLLDDACSKKESFWKRMLSSQSEELKKIKKTWIDEKSKEGLYYKTITDYDLKQELGRFKKQFNKFINKEVVRQYLIMLQTLYLCDNLDKTTDDYKKALASAGITESKLDFLDKWAPKKVEDENIKKEFDKKYDNSLRKQCADKITKLLDNEYLREFKDYFNKNKTVFDNVLKYSEKSYEKVFKEECNKMQDDKDLVLSQIIMIQSVALEMRQSNYQKASETLSEWIM
ncbi:MAG: hypothetical protein ACI4PR_05485 [Acutalibacteraceae bacterium]